MGEIVNYEVIKTTEHAPILRKCRCNDAFASVPLLGLPGGLLMVVRPICGISKLIKAGNFTWVDLWQGQKVI